MGRSAARQTAWLAIPILVIVAVMSVSELGGVQELLDMVMRFVGR